MKCNTSQSVGLIICHGASQAKKRGGGFYWRGASDRDNTVFIIYDVLFSQAIRFSPADARHFTPKPEPELYAAAATTTEASSETSCTAKRRTSSHATTPKEARLP